MLLFSIFLSFLAGSVLRYTSGRFERETAGASELSDPTVNIPPYWFYASHFRLLETISYYSWFGNPELVFIRDEEHNVLYISINWHHLNTVWKSDDRRASELAKMWFLNVRSEKTLRGKRNYYSINKRWREAILRFNDKF